MTSLRAAWIALVGSLICILAALAGAVWIFYSASGLQWLAARAVDFAGERLQIHDVSGTLAGGARTSAIEWTTDDLSVRVRQARFTLSPWALLTLSARVPDLAADRIEVEMKPSDDAPSALPDSIALPIHVSVHNARIGALVFDDAARVIELRDVHIEYAGGRRTSV